MTSRYLLEFLITLLASITKSDANLNQIFANRHPSYDLTSVVYYQLPWEKCEDIGEELTFNYLNIASTINRSQKLRSPGFELIFYDAYMANYMIDLYTFYFGEFHNIETFQNSKTIL